MASSETQAGGGIAPPKTLEVCKICFNASSQKPHPTLTQENKIIPGGTNNTKLCPTCKQPWSSISVAHDGETNRWVSIRLRPKLTANIDYTLCKAVLKRQPCNKGMGQCTFAHNRLELLAWNLERWKEPRSIPTVAGFYQFQLCRFVMGTGGCQYGQKCSYAHSEEELQHWIRNFKDRGGGNDRFNKLFQRDERNNFNTGGGWVPPTQSSDPRSINNHFIRPRPPRIPVSGFKMCFSVRNNKRCYYGDRCTFAHTNAELEAWNQERVKLRQSRVAAAGLVPKQPPTVDTPLSPPTQIIGPQSSGLDDIDDATPPGPPLPPVDFAHKVRTTVMLDYQEKETDKDLIGLEATVQGVTISLFGDQKETQSIATSNSSPLLWLFEITSSTPKTLQSVVLFDVLDPNYTIGNIELLSYNGKTPVPVQSRATQGEGHLVNQSLNPTEKIIVKIDLLKPSTGLVGQTILFDFGTFYIIRCLSVYIVSDQDRRSLAAVSRQKTIKRQGKLDLFWDQHYNVISWPFREEESDAALGRYELPEKVEEFIEDGKYKNVEQKVKKGSYVRRMHNLLYLEEYQQRKDISRYDLCDIKVEIKDRLEMVGEWINDPNYSFIHIDMNEVLFEGGCSIRKDDYCLIKPHNQDVVHESVVHYVQRESVIIKITKTAKEACVSSRNQCSLRFSLSRIPMRTMHQAVDAVNLDILFPDPSFIISSGTVSSDIDSHCIQELERSVLNNEQRKAVRSMIDPQYASVPTLVLGPFGCGKTRTLLECVSLLTRYVPDVHVLICTHTNSAADIYVEALHTEWLRHVDIRPKMCRIYYKERNIRTITPTVLSYCHTKDGQLSDMTPTQIMSYSIVVTTTMTARTMLLNGVRKGFFTHILLDEAAQVYEAEVLIPLSLADKNTKIVVAGDTMQMDPPVYSPIARRYGLNISLLERLFESEYYSTGPGEECKVHLTENHRSHDQILYLPSKLFYNDSLTCKAQFPPDGPKHIPRLQFVGVEGNEKQDEDSPSYYNDEEVYKIVEEVEQLHRGSVNPQQCLPLSKICVLSYFHSQVQRIRSCLRAKKLGQVNVYRIDNVQGREYRALLISTVRTCSSQDDNDDGFLNNVKLFNTAITRAQEWLIVVGEPITLCTVGYNSQCWLEFIRQCIELKTFRYPRSELFLNFLETKVVARHILHNKHREFITKATTSSTATTGDVLFSSDTRPLAQQLSALSLTPQQKASHVNSRVLSFMEFKDTDIANKIVAEVMKLDQSQFASFLQDEIGSKHVRDLEAGFRREKAAGSDPIGSVGGSTSSNVIFSNTMMGDLPSFLKNQIESLTSHLRFCDSKYPANSSAVSPDALNIKDQRALLMKQMNLLNDQILKYREYSKLTKYNPSGGIGSQLSQHTGASPIQAPPPSYPQHQYTTHQTPLGPIGTYQQQPRPSYGRGGGGYPTQQYQSYQGGHPYSSQTNVIGGGGPYRGGSGLAPGSSLMGRGPHPPATNIHHMGQGGMGMPGPYTGGPPVRALLPHPSFHHNFHPQMNMGPPPQPHPTAVQQNYQREPVRVSSISAPGYPSQQLSSSTRHSSSMATSNTPGAARPVQTTQLISPINDLPSHPPPLNSTTNSGTNTGSINQQQHHQSTWDSDDDM